MRPRAREVEGLLGTSNFRVLIGDRELGFSTVSRLTSGTLDEQQFAPVVLRRALSRSTELYEWRRAVAAGKDDRRDVTIQQLDRPGGEVVNVWRLVRAWPVRWSGPVFDALDAGIACEELELAFDDLTWNDSQGG
jgi:phage tail-like protein